MPKLTFPKEQMKEPWKGTSVTYGQIAQASNLMPVRMKLNTLYGFDNWGEDELGKLLMESRQNPNKKKRPKAMPVIAKAVDQDKLTVTQRLDALLSHFEPDSITANDMEAFRRLAELQSLMAGVNKQLNDPTLNLEISKQKGLLETYTKLSAESRQLEVSLGIDRSSRETQVDTASEVKRMTAAAKELLDTVSVKIVCRDCEREGVSLNQGFILFHFKDNVNWLWRSACPRCGREIYFENKAAGATGKPTEVPGIAALPSDAQSDEPDGFQGGKSDLSDDWPPSR